MTTGKVWRKGRWFWCCTAQNATNSCKDCWSCGAFSRCTFSNQKEADIAGKRHEHRTGHLVLVSQLKGKPKR